MARKRRERSNRAPLPGAFFATLAWMLATFGLAVFTQVRLQVADRSAVLAKAKSAQMLERSLQRSADRGTLYSADNQVLAQSRTAYEFGVFFDRVPSTPGFFMALAEAAGISEADISVPFLSGRPNVWLDALHTAQYKRVRRVMSEWGADGVSLKEQTSRVYPLRKDAIGLTGWIRDGVAQMGIELAYDKVLSGQGGSATGIYGLDGQFRQMGARTEARKDGADVRLTIDSVLQSVATDGIRRAVEINMAQSGAVVVLEPKTGNILAMASWPTFDPVQGPDGTSELMTSYMEVLPPGSTFKVLTLAKALEMGAVDGQLQIDCTGTKVLGPGRSVRCDLHNGRRAHGTVSLEEAIARSCNVSAATWALAVGRDEMIHFLRDVGLLDRSGLGLTAEAAPQFNFEAWDKERQLATLGFGQSLAVTPLGLASALSTIANDGVYVPPRLVSHVAGREAPMPEQRRVFSQDVARQVRRYMESVVHEEWGTADKLAIPGIRIAGKTGTAQKLGEGGGNVSAFVGMFPADHPRAVVLVVVNEPKAGEIYGSVVAGPAFDEIARAVIRQLKIPRSAVSDQTSSSKE
ncbi:MAG: penicillin-binding protein 2 [Armatimonadetes bacterium]|nr:penicillin-binding protein 2 [Armatimonadota bacterium]